MSNQTHSTQALPGNAPVPNGATASGVPGATHHGSSSQQGGSSTRPSTNGHHAPSNHHSSPPPTNPPSIPPPAPPSSMPPQQQAQPKNNRVSQPLPLAPTGAPTVVPPLPTHQPHQQQQQRDPEPQHPGQGGGASTNHILFYVKALYDYTATIDEEFDFQAGDVIAVTATPDDGWWSGELLDEARRVEGRHVFPSNFVCLF